MKKIVLLAITALSAFGADTNTTTHAPPNL